MIPSERDGKLLHVAPSKSAWCASNRHCRAVPGSFIGEAVDRRYSIAAHQPHMDLALDVLGKNHFPQLVVF